jgi:sugar lactone lactonase YvrE
MTCFYASNDPENKNDPGGAYIVAYPISANGNVAPLEMIRGSNTKLGNPQGVAVDSHGELYVNDFSVPPQVLVFPPGASGNVAPVRTISGPRTRLKFPTGLTVDRDGNIYVVDLENESSGGGSVSVFAAGANGNVAPLRKIIGGRSLLDFPIGIALDAARNIYVTTAPHTASRVLVFAAGANGDVKPIRVIAGGNTQLDNPIGLTLDSAGNIYVGNGIGDQVNVYGAGADGNVAPIRTVDGPRTLLRLPLGIVLDATGKLYVVDSNSGHPNEQSFVRVYAAGANGNVAPIGNIGGSNTEIESPDSIAMH